MTYIRFANFEGFLHVKSNLHFIIDPKGREMFFIAKGIVIGMSSTHILMKNASQLITLAGDNHGPRTGKAMSDLGIIENGDLWVSHNEIKAVGKDDRLPHDADIVIDCTGKVVMPGFVDPHTHLVFAGSRENELDMKLKGHTYLEILEAGGGILSTVRRTREATKGQLIDQATERLNRMLAHGTTTIEAKSGYGLDPETEIKLLEIAFELNSQHPIDIASTFLGAHAVPEEFKGRSMEYIDSMIGILPLIAKKRLARFCDVFCEKGAFTLEESRKMLEAAKQEGLRPKIHADEIENLGGSSLAAELKAISAEHLAVTSEEDMKAMAQAGVIGVLLPGTPYSLMMEYANARKLIEMGVPVALATDLNPNCWTESMQFIISLACYQMRMTPAEAIVASTINAAHAVDMADRLGSLEVGKKADIIILDLPNYQHIPYHFGVNHVETVIKDGVFVLGGPGEP